MDNKKAIRLYRQILREQMYGDRYTFNGYHADGHFPDSDYDRNHFYFVIPTTDYGLTKKARKKLFNLASELSFSRHIGSMYDCTGQLVGQHVELRVVRNLIIIEVIQNFDY